MAWSRCRIELAIDHIDHILPFSQKGNLWVLSPVLSPQLTMKLIYVWFAAFVKFTAAEHRGCRCSGVQLCCCRCGDVNLVLSIVRVAGVVVLGWRRWCPIWGGGGGGKGHNIWSWLSRGRYIPGDYCCWCYLQDGCSKYKGLWKVKNKLNRKYD